MFDLSVVKPEFCAAAPLTMSRPARVDRVVVKWTGDAECPSRYCSIELKVSCRGREIALRRERPAIPLLAPFHSATPLTQEHVLRLPNIRLPAADQGCSMQQPIRARSAAILKAYTHLGSIG